MRMCMACAEKEFGVDVSARKPVIKAIALAYCQEKGEAAAAAGAHLARSFCWLGHEQWLQREPLKLDYPCGRTAASPKDGTSCCQDQPYIQM